MNRVSVPVVRRGDRDASVSTSPWWHRASAHCRSWIAAFAVLSLALASAHAQANFGVIPVGRSAPLAEQTVAVTAQAAGTVSTVEVLTLGLTGLDFGAGNGASCQGATLTVGGATPSCQQSVTFDPTLVGLRVGAVVLLNSSGEVLGTAFVSGTGSGGLGVLMPGNLVSAAGDGGYLGTIDDGNQATDAELWWPTSQVLDGAGNLYIADSLHNRIRMVCAGSTSATITIKGTGSGCTAPGVIVTIAGTGDPAYSGDTGPAGAAALNDPSGVTLDGAGNLYIADTGNNVIREISAATGDIITIAGSNPANVCGTGNSVGDGCAALQATLSGPVGVTLDASGNLYIADTNDHRIRKVTVSTGDISTVAGNGTTDPVTGAGGYSGDGNKATLAELNYPYTVAFDPSGNMYIPDSGNHCIREVAAAGGVITTFAGNGTQGNSGNGGPANQAQLDSPLGVAVDAAGNVWIADTGNHAIRRVNPTTLDISPLLVTGTGTYYSNGNFIPIQLFGPSGLYFDGHGNLYIADSSDMIVRELQGNLVVIDDLTTPVRQYSQSGTTVQAIENDGNAPLDITAITPDTNSTVNDAGLGSYACAVSPPTLVADQACGIGAVFAPTVASNPLVANILVPGNTQDGPPPVTAVNSPLDIQIVGDATAVNSTTVAVTSSLNPAGYGQSFTLTATVETGAGTGNLTGTVTFYNGTTVLQANVPVGTTTTSGTTSSATASIPISNLPVGVDEITATYNVANDPTHLTSNNNASPFPETILEATSTLLTSNINPSAIGQTVTFTATVSISGGGGVTPDGTVTFLDGANTIGSSNLTASGSSATGSLMISTLAQGPHSITAQYSGGIVNPQVQPSTSNTVNQDVRAGTSVVVSGTPGTSIYGEAVIFTAVVTPAGATAASGAVNFYYNGSLIGSNNLVGSTNQTTISYSGLPVGTDNITATYVGDVNNAPSNSTVPWQQMVSKTTTTTTVSATPTPQGIAGGSVTFTATVQVTTGSATVTGNVTFAIVGGASLGTASINTSNGTASITLPDVSPASYSVVATYAGDNNDQGSVSNPFPYTIVQATTHTAVSFSPGQALVGQPVTFTATVTGNGGTPGGTVTFYANGTAIGAPATLSGGTATLTYPFSTAATYAITASYSSDQDDVTSTGSATSSLIVGTIPTTTDLGTASTTGPNAQVVLVAAVLNTEQVTGGTTPTPTGTITFKNGASIVGSATLDSNAVATLPLNLPAGTYTIIAYYSGDTTHSPSTSQPVTVSTTATNFNLSVTPGTVSMADSQNATVTVTLTSVAGFADSIGLGCASLPAAITCHFSPVTASLAANGITTAQLTIDTNNPLSGGAQAMNVQGGHRTALAGLSLPFAAFFGWVLWRFRRRNRHFLTMVVVLVLSVLALFATGCGGFTANDAGPGTYTIQVTGTGANSGVTHYQNVTITIT